MEHVVQFGVSIDDEAIQRQILNSAEKTIVGDLKREINEHKDEVIEAAANKIAEKVSRSKKFKEAIDGIVG